MFEVCAELRLDTCWHLDHSKINATGRLDQEAYIFEQGPTEGLLY